MTTWPLVLMTPFLGQAEPPAPFFGVWAHATQATTPTDADQLLDTVEAAGADALYLLVWYWGGHAYYRTDLSPMGEDVAPGFDPLGYLTEGCHQRGMEIHAWYVNGEVGSGGPGVVLEQHPDWAMVDMAGNRLHWYDLGQQEVRRFQSDLMVDVLRRYPVDGVHFDYIRHNGRTTCYCPSCAKAFTDETGMGPAAHRPDAIPCPLAVSANPLAEPTTATVLARFSNDLPAVYLNELGQGEVLGLNYHVERLEHGFAKEAVRRFLEEGGPRQDLPIVWPPETARDYSRAMPEAFADALRGLGHQPSIVDGSGIASWPAGGAAALVCAYRVSESLAAALAAWVEGGGRLVIIDGPVFAMGLDPMKRITGMAGTGRYFAGPVTVLPEAPGTLVPIREGGPDLDSLARFDAAWEAFQRRGPTALVRDVYQRARALRPQAKVTAAVFFDRSAADSVYQDWYGWLHEGIVDYVIPMCYTRDDEVLERALDEWQQADPRLERILPGLSLFQHDTQPGNRPPEEVVGQVMRCMTRGARGTVFFSAHNLDAPLVQALAGAKRTRQW